MIAYIYIYIYGNGWIQMGKGRSLGGSFGVKSPELDESGEGTTHDHRSLGYDPVIPLKTYIAQR